MTFEELEERGWRVASCFCHGGTIGGYDGYPQDCGNCAGNGIAWIRPGGAVCMYPGGPWLGNWGVKAYAHAGLPTQAFVAAQGGDDAR